MAHDFLAVFLKDLLNLPEEGEKIKGEKAKPIVPGEDQEDFNFSYQEAFGDNAKYFIFLKVFIMGGLITYWFVVYVLNIIDSKTEI